jgi:hypothetical protein
MTQAARDCASLAKKGSEIGQIREAGFDWVGEGVRTVPP